MQRIQALATVLAFQLLAGTALAGITVPKPQVFSSHKDVYQTGAGEQVLMILHLPKDAGPAYVEIYNRTKIEISLLQFTLTALGHEGELEFDDLPPGWSAVKEVQLSSLRELEIRNPKAYNANADEISPRLVIHQIQGGPKGPKVGKRKV